MSTKKKKHVKQVEEQPAKLTEQYVAGASYGWYRVGHRFLPWVDFMTHWQRCATLVIMLLI